MSFFQNNALEFNHEFFNTDNLDIQQLLQDNLDPIGDLSFEAPTSNPPAGFQPQCDITNAVAIQPTAAVQQPVDPNLLKQVYAQLLTPYIERHVQTLLQNTSLNQQIISQVIQQPHRPTSPHHHHHQLPLIPSSPPQSAPITIVEQSQPQQQQLTVSAAVSRESKLQKYRLKRQKRNYNRPVDQDKSRVANSRPRDAHGHFLPGKVSRRVTSDLANKLALSESECQKLREDLGNRERVMIELQAQLLQQQIVNEEQQMRLLQLQGLPVFVNQQSINEKRQRLEQMLRILESRTPPQTPLSLSSEPQSPLSVMEVHTPQGTQPVIQIEDETEQSNKKKLGGPPSEIYNPPWPRNTMIPAFAEKIDFNKIELKKSLDPPSWVEISKREYMEAQKNWQMHQEEIAKFVAEHPGLFIDANGNNSSSPKEKLELRKTTSTSQFTVPYNTNAVNTNNVNNNDTNTQCNNNNNNTDNSTNNHTINTQYPAAQYIQLGQVMIPTPTAAIWRAALQDPEFVRQHQQQVHFMLD